jgi:hypothetical protein
MMPVEVAGVSVEHGAGVTFVDQKSVGAAADALSCLTAADCASDWSHPHGFNTSADPPRQHFRWPKA